MKVLLFVGVSIVCCQGFAGTRQTTVEYIDLWKSTAIEQMKVHKIPASITLAQGILESGSGNSKLAQQANNHFGIKCHKAWTGDTFVQDDDTKDECFRSYNSAADSYTDHSLFLSKRGRYSSLFELRKDNYRAWAKGLKSAGYATNPKYAYLLIDLIERYHLNQYDKLANSNISVTKTSRQKEVIKPVQKVEKSVVETKIVKPVHKDKARALNYSSGIESIQIEEKGHKVATSINHVKYITIRAGDTFFRISKEFDITIAQLYKYNEFKNKDVLEVGDRIYISPKRSRGARGNSNYVCSSDITYRSIAHEQGIKLSSLMKLNLSENPDAIVSKGSKVTLR